ncbi:MAG: DNA gyrase inhibitor YacG [Alphaproteobacteria bacterium]|nr:DNA gyrase inhibitor YacG [Alphaproteobacteria bacterium]
MSFEKRCPVCQKPSDEKFMPFCSSRCAKVDLGRWFSESYVVETEDELEQEEPVE